MGHGSKSTFAGVREGGMHIHIRRGQGGWDRTVAASQSDTARSAPHAPPLQAFPLENPGSKGLGMVVGLGRTGVEGGGESEWGRAGVGDGSRAVQRITLPTHPQLDRHHCVSIFLWKVSGSDLISCGECKEHEEKFKEHVMKGEFFTKEKLDKL